MLIRSFNTSVLAQTLMVKDLLMSSRGFETAFFSQGAYITERSRCCPAIFTSEITSILHRLRVPFILALKDRDILLTMKL